MMKILNHRSAEGDKTIWTIVLPDKDLEVIEFEPEEQVFIDLAREEESSLTAKMWALALIVRKVEEFNKSAEKAHALKQEF